MLKIKEFVTGGTGETRLRGLRGTIQCSLKKRGGIKKDSKGHKDASAGCTSIVVNRSTPKPTLGKSI